MVALRGVRPEPAEVVVAQRFTHVREHVHYIIVVLGVVPDRREDEAAVALEELIPCSVGAVPLQGGHPRFHGRALPRREWTGYSGAADSVKDSHRSMRRTGERKLLSGAIFSAMTTPNLATDTEPRPTATNIDVFGLSDRGRVRAENQDQFLIASLHKLLRVHQSSLPPEDITTLISESRGYILLVADGVAGRPDGQAASGTVVKTIAHHVTHLMDLYRRLDSGNERTFVSELEKSVLKSHDVLVQEGKKEYGGRGGATTLTMVAALWPNAYVIQVGDSRCYRLRDGGLERVTEDQTLAQALLDKGALTVTEAHRSPLQGVLASALGGRDVSPRIYATDCRWDDIVLLCTDGLTRHVTDAEIEAELRAIRSAQQSCQRLIQLALDRGGADNLTVVIGRLKNKPG